MYFLKCLTPIQLYMVKNGQIAVGATEEPYNGNSKSEVKWHVF